MHARHRRNRPPVSWLGCRYHRCPRNGRPRALRYVKTHRQTRSAEASSTCNGQHMLLGEQMTMTVDRHLLFHLIKLLFIL